MPVSNSQNCSGPQQTWFLKVKRRSGEGNTGLAQEQSVSIASMIYVKQEAASVQVPVRPSNEHSVVPNGSHGSPCAKAKVLKR